MKLVFVTQAIDADDPNLAATTDMARALAKRCSELVVICDRVRRHDLPPNVSFRTFAAPTRFRRGLRYLGALAATLRGGRPDAIFAHMCPIYLIIAAPLALPLRIPLVIWYTHWDNDWTLRVATPLCSVALSVETASFPLRSRKVRGIGHGIDMSHFAPRRELPARDGEVRFVALGRIEPWKGLVTLLKGFEIAARSGLRARLEIRGPTINESERAHRAELVELIRRSPVLSERVSLEEPVTRERVPDLIRSFDALISPTRGQTSGGALDKVVYEASGCAVPVIACNPHLAGYLDGLPLELLFRSDDPEDLARVLIGFAESDRETRAAVGLELRRRAEAGHSVESWADKVVQTVRELRR